MSSTRVMRMHRLLRVIQSTSCRGLSTQTRPSSEGSNFSKATPIGAAAFIACGTAIILQRGNDDLQAGQPKPRIYSLDEFKNMVAEGRIVIAYQGDLYDMTNFTGHPGGVGRLQMAAGNDLEVYWRVYTQHNRGHIQKHMQPYKIGEVTEADMAVITANTYYDDSAYENNPPPYPDLLVNTRYF